MLRTSTVMLSFIVLLSSCASLSLNDVFRAPTFRYQETKIGSVTWEELNGVSVTRITNNNPYALPISSLKTELWLEGKPWLELSNRSVSSIPASGGIDITFDWTMVFARLIEEAKPVYDKGEADFTLVMTPTFNVPLLGLQSFTFRGNFTVAVPKLPSVQVKAWRIENVSLSNLTLAMDLGIKNPNMFGIGLDDWALNVRQNGQRIADVSIADTTIRSQGETTTPVALSLSVADVGISLFNALRNKRWPDSIKLDWSGSLTSDDFKGALPPVNGRLSGL